MRHRFCGVYPADWSERATAIKEASGLKCERCGSPSVPKRILTVHHLDGNKSNCEPFNLAALCQKCHLTIQGRVNMFQEYLFEHSAWMQPHVEGRNWAIADGTWPPTREAR